MKDFKGILRDAISILKKKVDPPNPNVTILPLVNSEQCLHLVRQLYSDKKTERAPVK